MARNTPRPGRTLVVFFLGVAILYGLVTLGGTWKPALGLDLEGGTRITLIAKGNPSQESINEARKIIDERVNGSGVAESEVTTQGNRFVVIEIPKDARRDLIDTVQRQAQLRFRLVACAPGTGACAAAAGASAGSGTGSTTIPGVGAGTTGGTGGTGGNNRPAPAFGRLPSADTSPSASPSASPSTSPSTSPSASPSGDASPSADPSASGSDAPLPGTVAKLSADQQKLVDTCLSSAADDKLTAKPLDWRSKPTSACIAAYNAYQCPTAAPFQAMPDDPKLPLITCSDDGIPYLLSAAAVEGTNLKTAGTAVPQGGIEPVVTLQFDGTGTKQFADISTALVGSDDLFAIVLDGSVISAPRMTGRIVDGNAQIEGDFTQASATSLATSLRYGSLPIAFEKPSTQTIGPSLAGDQLNAGIVAGLIGLILVAIYCLVYYRGLGLVVLGSLAVAAAITYAMVLLLGVSAGFTLTLPGIAGLIIAVGITADSFIIFFERIRDEMREGKSMRVAVESGWARARVTRLAANVVSLLSASVLYLFATGVVKGFGFALGLSTVIDLAVLFWFTKPAVSFLARYRFFNGGGKMSGLSPESLGMDASAIPRTSSLSSKLSAGGNA